MSQHHKNDEQGRPECGQAGRHLLDHEAPDQHHHRQQVVQSRFHGGPGFRQFEYLRIGVIQWQLGLARTKPQQAHVGCEQRHTNDPYRGASRDILDPAHTPVHRPAQHKKPRNREPQREQARATRGRTAPWQAHHIGLEGLQVHDVEQRNVGNDGRQERVLHHFDVGNTHVFHHQESCGPHHGRHQLAVDRAGDFHGTRLVRPVAHTLHQRNGESPGGDHVGDRRAGNDAGRRRRQYRGLGRAAAHVAQQGKGRLDEVVASACLVEQGTEQHEQENEPAGNPQRHAKHTLGGQPLVAHRAVEREPPVGDHVRHVAPAKGVAQEHQGHDHHGQTQHAARRFKQKHHTDHRRVDVHVGGVARPRPLQHLHDQIRKKHRKSEVNGPAFGVVEHQNTERERKRRRDPELEQRPGQRDAQKKETDLGPGRASAQIVVGDKLLDVDDRCSSGCVGGVHGCPRNPWMKQKSPEKSELFCGRYRRALRPRLTSSPFPCSTSRRLDGAAHSCRP